MKVARIRIQNVMGIEELEINDPGSVTTVEARNGKGKTSLIEAIRSVVEGGHDATLIRNGADVGEVVIVLDDETTITKRITAEGSKLSVTRPDIGEIRSPKSYVDRLFNALSVNPIQFLNLPEKEQARALLEIAPLKLDRGAVEALVGDLITLRESDFRGHPLEVLEGIDRRVYDERTGVNRAAKEKQGTVNTLKQGLTDPDETDYSAEIASLEAERDELASRFLAEREAIDEWMDSTIESSCSEIDVDMAQLRERLTVLEAERASRVDQITREADSKHAAIDQTEPAKKEELKGRIQTLRAKSETQTATRSTRRTVAQLEREIQALNDRSGNLTTAREHLDNLRLAMLKDLPIRGLEVREGILYKGDVPFRRLNKAEQVKVAIRLAQLQAGDVPLVCVDGIEALDGPTFEAFRKHASQTDLQFIVTRVTPETQDAPQGLQVLREAVPA